GRWGGEEFMILLENCQNREAGKLAEEIKGHFSQMHFPVSGTHTLSCGLTGAMRGDTTDSLTGRVDKGLYLAKEQGRNRIVAIAIS
ncbi:MAG: diguanylate cyclase, partial [Blautia sp.]|nr:diguanylate cyclase [Blautia sp.]